MEQVELDKNIPSSTKFDHLSKEDVVQRYGLLEKEYRYALQQIYRLKNQSLTDDQLKLVMAERLSELNDAAFGASSEKYKKKPAEKGPVQPPKPQRKRPSERYPNVPIRDAEIEMDPPPSCCGCGSEMSDSGMTEDSEQLTVIPKKYEIIRQKRKKYRCCSCHGGLTTAPAPERIVAGSAYSDEMILDVGLSKYCDLIPIERYVQMAARSGVKDIPPQSLIECTHGLADYLIGVYLSLKRSVMTADVLAADETPHRMLEGSEKKSWHLWGFSTKTASFFECRDTRSGDVASEILQYAHCQYLISDVYSGYGKAIRESNKIRLAKGLPEIKNANCNAHARRYFFKSSGAYEASCFYLDQYAEIYRLRSLAESRDRDGALEVRQEMRPYFEGMRARALDDLGKYSDKSKIAKALGYYLDNYEGLTLCLSNPDVPIDNNSQERLFRAPVVGRKTWYGTHSERGARTAAILFSIIESCKLNQVNPREFCPVAIDHLRATKTALTPEEFKKQTQDAQGPSPPD